MKDRGSADKLSVLIRRVDSTAVVIVLSAPNQGVLPHHLKCNVRISLTTRSMKGLQSLYIRELGGIVIDWKASRGHDGMGPGSHPCHVLTNATLFCRRALQLDVYTPAPISTLLPSTNLTILEGNIADHATVFSLHRSQVIQAARQRQPLASHGLVRLRLSMSVSIMFMNFVSEHGG